MMTSRIIEFKGRPLFKKAEFNPPFLMQGEIKDFACFFYMTKGIMLSYDGRGRHQINEREAIMKQCGNYVQQYLAAEGSDTCEAIAIYLYPELLREIYRDEVPSFMKDSVTRLPKKFVGNKLIEQYILNLSLYFENPDVLDEELGIIKIRELIMILLKSVNHANIRRLLSEIFNPVDLKLKDAINANLLNNLSMEQLAFICNMSLSTFKRKFKEVYDETPARYLRRRRLEHAASLLICGNEPITNVCYDSGFVDVTTFSALFHDKFGMSPSKYRQSMAVETK